MAVRELKTEYKPNIIERKWQQIWEQRGLHLSLQETDKPKYYCMDFFPYPSGDGLHVGHCRNYVPTDVVSRYHRMQGFNVLHPMGWDSFGEPTEQFAISHGVHPEVTTRQNTDNFRRQMKLIGTSYDWSREINSSSPDYYRWTQWFFLLLYKRGLAYRDTNWQWWCPTCQTTLSSHEAAGGVCWRGHTGITRREIPAWYFRITDYADRLLEGLDRIDWPESIKTIQRNWIGKSEGLLVKFHLDNGDFIETFTTRPDTLFGVTFLLLAPEHPMVDRVTSPDRMVEVRGYIEKSTRQSEIERMNESRAKTGVFTGQYAQHPLSRELIPIWVTDYVLLGYGTGAVMGVPAHDERDFQFAKTFDLPVTVVIKPPNWAGEILPAAQLEPGEIINSGIFNGLDWKIGSIKIANELVEKGLASKSVQYRMRDWLISRQRYWGTPIPIVYCAQCGEVPIPEEQLPVLLPEMDNFQPDGSGRSPLARVPEFVHTSCPKCGGPAQRETDTMGGFACSSWYFLRFANNKYEEGPFDPQAVNYWLPVDLYVGGAEHAVLHLLYSRFWVKVMFDSGLVSFDEPFSKLLNQGQLMGTDGQRMSKSRGNVITPDAIAKKYGADSLRLYTMFMAPFDQDANWSMAGINGTRRFLNKIWALVLNTYEASAAAQNVDRSLEMKLNKIVKNVTLRIESLRFNTMVSLLMEFSNDLMDCFQENAWHTKTYHHALETFMLLLAPSVPHIADELWQRTGHAESIHGEKWPVWDEDKVLSDSIQVIIQINGKKRDVIDVPADATQEEIKEIAMDNERIQTYVSGMTLEKLIYVKGKVLNFVVRS